MVLPAGCGASPAPSGELGVFAREAAGAAAPAADGGSFVVPTGAVSAQDVELTARIATPAGLTLEVLTVACAGDCADVVAVAHGGNPPYHVTWEDGSTAAARHVCPEGSGELKVDVTDSAIRSTEFGYEPRTASARMTSQVLACADAGTDAAEPACQPTTVSMADVEGCSRLTPRACGASVFRGQYDLPFSLDPGNQSCMVVFGNPEVLTLAEGLNVRVYADGTPDESSCKTAGSAEWLWHNDGSVPANSDPSVGRILCLSDPSTPYQKVMVTALGLDGEQDVPADYDIRICKQCPAAR